MRIDWARYTLDFKFEARTSRERMPHKDTYFVRVRRDGRTAYGECALFRGLSADDTPDYEERLDYYCRNLDRLDECPLGAGELARAPTRPIYQRPRVDGRQSHNGRKD